MTISCVEREGKLHEGGWSRGMVGEVLADGCVTQQALLNEKRRFKAPVDSCIVQQVPLDAGAWRWRHIRLCCIRQLAAGARVAPCEQVWCSDYMSGAVAAPGPSLSPNHLFGDGRSLDHRNALLSPPPNIHSHGPPPAYPPPPKAASAPGATPNAPRCRAPWATSVPATGTCFGLPPERPSRRCPPSSRASWSALCLG